MHPNARWSLRIAAVVVLLVLIPAAVVVGQVTTPLLEDPVTDSADVLSDSEERGLEERLEGLHDTTRVQLWALYLDALPGQTAPELAEATAANNGLGVDDALLLVAFDDRAYALWVPDGMTEVTDDEIDSILAERVEPALRNDDPAGAAIGAAEGLGAALGGLEPTVGPTPVPGASAPPDGGSGAGSGGGLPLLPIVVLVLVGAFLLFRWLRTRQPAPAEAAGAATGRTPSSDVSGARLRRESTAALVEADEAVRDAETALSAAETQWGAETVRPLRDGIAAARSEVDAAFALRRQVDDDQPEPAPQRTALLEEILQRAQRAQARLAEELEKLDRLRDLETTAPQLLDALGPRIADLGTRRVAAQGALDALTSTYGPDAVAPVRGNLVEAEKALEGVRREIERGRAAAASGDTRTAATALRHCEDGLAAAASLIDAVDRLGAALADASSKVGALLAEVDRDIAAARSALAGSAAGVTDGALREQLEAAERLTGEARDLAEPPRRDPLAALERATAADAAIDAVLEAIAQRSEAARREAAALDATLASARTRLERARGYVATRRHGVGDRARAHLAEAERLVAQAGTLAAPDRARALELAHQAERVADEAYALASREFDGWQPGGGPVAGPYAGSGGTDVIGAILGGIIGGVLSGGGRGAGWGGSPWGTPWPGGRSGRSSGGFGLPMPRGPGWGGGGMTRGGGGIGGGGGRARGGRW